MRELLDIFARGFLRLCIFTACFGVLCGIFLGISYGIVAIFPTWDVGLVGLSLLGILFTLLFMYVLGDMD